MLKKKEAQTADILHEGFLPSTSNQALYNIRKIGNLGGGIIVANMAARVLHANDLAPELFSHTSSFGDSLIISCLAFSSMARRRLKQAGEVYTSTLRALGVGAAAAAIGMAAHAAIELPLVDGDTPIHAIASEWGGTADPIDFVYGAGGAVVGTVALIEMWRRPEDDTLLVSPSVPAPSKA